MDKISVLDNAVNEIVQRAADRHALEMEAHKTKLQDRREQFEKTGQKPRGKEPSPPAEGPRDKDQINLTDLESRIMPNSDKGFSQAYNAQICAESKNMIIAETHVTQNTNDKNELVQALDNLENLPKSLGKPSKVVADAGYFSQDNIEACEEKKIDPYIPPGRIHHHPTLTEQLAPASAGEVLPDAAPSEKMRPKLKTEAGKAVYKLRKQVVEPVFGVMKSVMGFRRFSQRGLDKTSPEWQFASTCYNLKKIQKLHQLLVYRETNRYEWSYSQKYQKLSLDIRSTERISLKTALK